MRDAPKSALSGLRRTRRFAIVGLAGLLASPPAFAGLAEALRDGKSNVSARYRYESVDQDGLPNNASASTVLGRLTWSSAAWGNLTAGIETDFVGVVGVDDYNSTTNGKTTYPVVADPEGFDLNQAFVRRQSGAVTMTGGRQRILHGRQRFLGGVAWRQNEQTYDAVRIESKGDDVTLDYSFIANVNRIFGPEDGAQPADWQSAIHAFRGVWSIGDGEISAFAYDFDLQNDNGIPNSNRTYGAEYTGEHGGFTLSGGIARQSPSGDSPLDYDAGWYWVEGKTSLGGVTFTLGHEVLGSDGGEAGFRMPVATLHKFNGWTDRFLATPAAGLEDTYLTMAENWGKVSLAATLHAFSANEGSADYGKEFDLSASMPLGESLTVLFKFATYASDGYAADTTKWWLTFTYKP